MWRLVLDKIISYSEVDTLNFKDALKLNSLLDVKAKMEKEASEKMKK